MPDLKELLKELQVTDSELHALLIQKDQIPGKITSIEEEINELSRRLDETKKTITDSRKELKMAELNLASKEEALAKYNSQLFSAKTNEEYKAFLKEIETAERKKREFEDLIIEIMERIEREEAELIKREEELKTEDVKKRKDIAEVKISESELEEKISKLNDKYERLRSEVPVDILVIYDRIKKNKDGLGVALIQEPNRCSACLNPVPAQKAIEAAHSNNLIFCEYCGRILIP